MHGRQEARSYAFSTTVGAVGKVERSALDRGMEADRGRFDRVGLGLDIRERFNSRPVLSADLVRTR